MQSAATTIEIGDWLMYEGRPSLVHGFTPMGVEPARIYLADASGSDVRAAPADAVERLADAHRRREALQLLPTKL